METSNHLTRRTRQSPPGIFVPQIRCAPRVTCMEEKTEVIPGEGGSKPTRRTTKKEEPKVVEIPARLCDANKAAELLGKRYGLFTDRVDVSGSLPVILAGEDALDD